MQVFGGHWKLGNAGFGGTYGPHTIPLPQPESSVHGRIFMHGLNTTGCCMLDVSRHSCPSEQSLSFEHGLSDPESLFASQPAAPPARIAVPSQTPSIQPPVRRTMRTAEASLDPGRERAQVGITQATRALALCHGVPMVGTMTLARTRNRVPIIARVVGPEPFVVSAVYDGARAPQNRCVLRPRRHGRAWSQDLGAGD
jgi:hypothetical protein